MKNFLPDTSPASRRRRDADEPEQPLAQSVPVGPAPTEVLSQTASGGAGNWQLEGPSDGGYPAGDSDAGDTDGLPAVDHEPFVPKSGYVMGRSTKVLVGVLLVVAGGFGGSVVQKQIDVGDRAARISNFQGPGAGTGAGAGTGTPTPGQGQGRRNGGTGSGAPAGPPPAAGQ